MFVSREFLILLPLSCTLSHINDRNNNRTEFLKILTNNTVEKLVLNIKTKIIVIEILHRHSFEKNNSFSFYKSSSHT